MESTAYDPVSYTHLDVYKRQLWCLLSAPLIVSCDLEHIDSFTMGLLTNDEVIAVDQDPAASPARKAWRQGTAYTYKVHIFFRKNQACCRKK